LASNDSGNDSLADLAEHGNKPYGSIKGRGFLEQLRD
jgi:hypothetical protein